MVTGLGADALGAADPTAAEIDLLVVGGYRADELGLTIDGPTAASLADGVLVCVGNRISLVLTLVPGNVLDALGAANDPLARCAVDALDPALVHDFLAAQLVDGPDVYVTPVGGQFIDASFAAVADCADRLGIERTPPP